MISSPYVDTVTVYSTEAKALDIASQIAKDDPDWMYVVQPYGRGFVIVVHDEDNNILGKL